MSNTKDVQTESAIERAIQRLADPPRPKEALDTAHAGGPSSMEPKKAPDLAADALAVDSGRVQPRVVTRIVPPSVARRIEIDLGRLESQGIFSPIQAPNRTTEEFRLIKRAVLLNIQEARVAQSKNPNLIMVTSSRQNEGKSFASLNLALSLAAETDRTVLLIDGDPTHASITKILEVTAEKGLLDLLQDPDLKFSDVLLRTNMKQLSILPAGAPDLLSTEILAGSTTANLLKEISQRYDDRIIVLDTPPVLATSEPSALALHVGQVVFVVDAGRTTSASIKEALNLIAACPNIGFVLNRAKPQFGIARFGTQYAYYKNPHKNRGASVGK